MVIFSESQCVQDVGMLALFAILPVIFVGGFIFMLIALRRIALLPKLGAIAVALPVVILVGVVLPAMTFSMNLTTEVRTDGIYVRFFPFHGSFHRYPFSDIAGVYVRTYDAVPEYHGWGLKAGPSGQAYSVSGGKGLQIIFKNGTRLLIGTQQPDSLARAIAKATGSRWPSS